MTSQERHGRHALGQRLAESRGLVVQRGEPGLRPPTTGSGGGRVGTARYREFRRTRDEVAFS